MKKMITLALAAFAASIFAADSIPLSKEMFRPAGAGTIGTFMEEDGLTAIELKGVTGDVATGNKYLNCTVILPEAVNLSGKMLAVKIKTDTPEVLKGFYFRAYNQDDAKTPALSFMSWKSPLKSNYEEIIMIPGNNGVLDWEEKVVSGKNPETVNRFRIDIGTPTPNANMNVKIKEIKVLDNPLALVGDIASGLGGYKRLVRSTFARAPQISTEELDGAKVLRCSSVAPEQHSQANRYDGIALAFDPIDLAGKTVEFELKGTANINGLYVRFFKDNEKKAAMSFVMPKMPADWTAVSLKAGESGSFRWQAEEVSGSVPDAITKVDFIFSCPKGGETFGIELRNFKVE